METLTLEQVKAAGRDASHPSGVLLIDGQWRCVFGSEHHRTHGWSAYSDDHHLPDDGWHHFEGCDCEFCNP